MSAALEPRHPAARTVHDEQGSAITLGLSEAELRLECLKVVERMVIAEIPAHRTVGLVVVVPGATDIARRAAVLTAFVLGTGLVEPKVTSQLPNVHNLDARVGSLEAKVDRMEQTQGQDSPAEDGATGPDLVVHGIGALANGTYSRETSAATKAEPASPLLSDVSRHALVKRKADLKEELSKAEKWLTHEQESADGFRAKVARIREEIEAVQRDLGETSPT